MRDAERIKEIIPLIQAIWEKYPDLRFGQLMLNIANLSGWPSTDLFYLEDDQLLLGIQKMNEVIYGNSTES